MMNRLDSRIYEGNIVWIRNRHYSSVEYLNRIIDVEYRDGGAKDIIIYDELNREGNLFENDRYGIGPLLEDYYVVREIDESEWVAARLSDGTCWPEE